MTKWRVATLACLLPIFADRVSAQVLPPPPPQVVTTGRGEVRAAPDRATILFAVETRGATAAASGAENARLQRAVLDTLRRLGLTDEQLSTLGYQVHPEYLHEERKSPRITGYIARNSVRVEARRLDMLGRYIDGALAAGANQISSLVFGSTKADELRREALAAAVTRARADAEAMARAAGGSLGSLLEITSGFEYPRPMEQATMRMAADAAETPILAGDQMVTATVTARWAFVSR